MRSFPSAATVLCVFALAACDSGTQTPDKQYAGLADNINKGEVAAAYSSFIPASYDQDLNEVLGKVKEIVAKEEFGKIQSTLKKVGAQIGGMLAAQEPSLQGVGQKLKDPLALLGIESYDSFKSADVKGVVKSLQDSLLKNLITSEGAKKKVGKFEFIVTEKDGAKQLTSKTTSPEGTVDEKTVELQEVDGKWIPKDLATEWATQIGDLRKNLDGVVAEKATDPEAFTAKLDQTLAQAETQLGGLLGMFGAFGGGAPVPPGGVPGGGFPGGLPTGDE